MEALFKRGLERKCKSKNVLEFDVEKNGGIIFGIKIVFKRLYFLRVKENIFEDLYISIFHCLSIHLAIQYTIYISIYIYLYMYITIHLFFIIYFLPSPSLSTSLSFPVSLSLSVRIFLSLSLVFSQRPRIRIRDPSKKKGADLHPRF